jgi:hypothetical protein
VVVASTNTTITSDTPDPSVVGQTVTVAFTVTSGGGTPTGTVAVSDGVDGCSASVAAGSCNVTLTTSGARTLTAIYSPDTGNFTGSSDTEPHTVTVAAPVITENPQSQTAVVGSTVTFTSRAGVFSQNAPGSLASGQSLLPGEFLISPNYGYQLIYQTDGNLVLYRGDGVALWTSNTGGTTPGQAIMQADGNFVIYDSGGTPIFATGTANNPGATLALQSDGNAVIYNAGNPIYATGTSSNYPIPSVQWQVSTNGGANFTDIGGATTPILSFTVGIADNGNQYRAVFTNPAGLVASSAAVLTVNKADTTTTITGDTPDPSTQGQSVTVSYSIAVVAPGAGTPTGNVTVSDGVDSCVGTAAAGQCSLTLNTLGNRTLTATYDGDASFNGSVSIGEPHTVIGVPPVVTEDPQNQTVGVGAPVTFTSRGGVFSQTAPSSLSGGQALLPGESLISPNYGYQFVYQTDGNLVLYRGNGNVLWTSNTAGHIPGQAVMQGDGNFVIYDSGGTPQFATDTGGNPGAMLFLQSDGNVVIANAGNPIFATGTASGFEIPTVQWQVSTNGGANFTDIVGGANFGNISGATTPILNFIAQITDNGNQYRAVFTNNFGAVMSNPATLTVLTPTAANVFISGRVLTNSGRGISNAMVVMTDSGGELRYARTNPFGYYRFENVEVGQTYIFNVRSKQYIFAPQVISVSEDLTGLNFTAITEVKVK